jgi:hypothetical protein
MIGDGMCSPPHGRGALSRADPRMSGPARAVGPGEEEGLMAQVRVTVDGVQYLDEVEPRTLLVY